jgi:hypothetical protein
MAHSNPDPTISGFTSYSDGYASNTVVNAAAAGDTLAIQLLVVDSNGIPMADGATIGLKTSDGTVADATFTVAANQAIFDTTFKTPTTSGTATITVKVTQPASGTVDSFTLYVVVP